MVENTTWKSCVKALPLAAILLLALCLRTAGLFRGLQEPVEYHPDVPKQIQRLQCYLHGEYYIHHGGNYFYDGYPFGLNRLDEWLIRIIHPAQRALEKHISPGVDPANELSKIDLYYWARGLRVLYGMIVVLAAYFIARAVNLSRGAALFAALAMAIAPLSVTVSHMATGDIGVDLFTACALLAMAAGVRSARVSPLSFCLVGLSLGFGFACKYQALLVAWVPIIFLVIRYGLLEWRPATLLRMGLIVILCFVAAVVVVNPMFYLEPSRSWHDMLADIALIQRFRTDPELLEKPLFERLGICLSRNTPVVFNALGWSLVGLAAVGLLMSLKEAVRKGAALRNDQTLILNLAVFSLPFAAIAASLVGKPAIQPFHFSFLQLPVVLSAVCVVVYLFRSSNWFSRLAAVLFGLAMIHELGNNARNDDYFWRREDIRSVGAGKLDRLLRSSDDLLTDNAIVRKVMLESGGVSVFRNRPQEILIPHGGFWNTLAVPPVPCVIYPFGYDWIFANGPLFPRSDRLFRVLKNASVNKTVVFYEEPNELKLGIRSDFKPVEISLQCGRRRRTLQLPPDSYQIISFPDPQCRLVDREHKVNTVSLKATTTGGQAWIAVLLNDVETANFLLFSGFADASPARRLLECCANREEVVSQVQRLRYLDGNFQGKRLAAGESCEIPCGGLPAGAYTLRYQVSPLSQNVALRLSYGDRLGNELQPLLPEMTNVVAVAQTMVATTRFEKTFVPYTPLIDLNCVSGNCVLMGWEILPDTRRILDDLVAYTSSNVVPAWLDHSAQTQLPSNRDRFAGVRFGGQLELEDVAIPTTLHQGRTDILCVMRVIDFSLGDLHKYQVFLHFLDSKGNQVAASGLALFSALGAKTSGSLIPIVVPYELPDGEYDVYMGVYDIVSGKRMKISLPASGALTIDDRRRLHVMHVNVK